MSDWVYVCESSEIDFEDLKRFDHQNKTYCIYNI